jgi:hypothetical protein
MSLPTSITLTDQMAGTLVFEQGKLLPNGMVYVAPSPNNDIAGCPTLRVETNRTSKNIERTMVKLVIPVWDADSASYPQFDSIVLQMNRHANRSAVAFRDEVEKLLSLGPQSSVITPLCNAQL